LLRDDRKLDWRPAYTTVAGFLPTSEWGSQAGRQSSSAPVALAKTQIQVTTGGPVKLSLDATEGLSFYLDGRRVEPAREHGAASGLVLDLKPGAHHLAVAFPSDRRDGIRCILEDVPGSPARAQAVLGK
jgi:hypothetical protein